MRQRTLIFLLLVAGALAAQERHRVNWENRARQDKNNFFWYSCYVTQFPYWKTKRFDTLNYCRIRNSHIRSVTVFKLTTRIDSIPITTIDYDSTGIPVYERELMKDSAWQCISCDGVTPQLYEPNQSYVKKLDARYKTVVTDSLGYMSSYSLEIPRNLWDKLFPELNWPDEKWEYTYSRDHHVVTCVYSQKTPTVFFNRWTPMYKEIYVLDENNNLVIDYSYRITESGAEVFAWGFNYTYQYY